MVCLLVPFSVGVMLLAMIWLAVLPRRMQVGLCGSCAYSLSGLGQQGICPECGANFDTRAVTTEPTWGSDAEHFVLGGLPIVFGVASASLYVAASVINSSMGLDSLIPPIIACASAVPCLVVVLIARISVSRMATWLICTSCLLPGLGIAAIVFLASLGSSMWAESPGNVIAAFYGAMASVLIGGIVGCGVAVREEVRIARSRAETRRKWTLVARSSAPSADRPRQE